MGDYISIYDIQRAVADQATVPIYYDSRIAVDLYNAIIALRPDWASAPEDDAEKGKHCEVNVVMTGSVDDGPEWQPLLLAGQEHILARDSSKPRWQQGGTELSRAFALRAAETERLPATWPRTHASMS